MPPLLVLRLLVLPLLLPRAAALHARSLASCSSDNPGDSTTAACEAWCAVTEKKYDCAFCTCKACAFCGGGAAEPAPSGGTVGVATAAKVNCAMGVTVELIKAWGGTGPGSGFRLEVVVQQWKEDAEITLAWNAAAAPPAVGAVFAASVASTSDDLRTVRFRLKP
eukprot:1940067-Prymnesium_polylepis.1